MTIIKTDPDLRPKLRYLNILNQTLEKENFRLVKSSNAFKRELEFGPQVISFSFISTMGAIHGIQILHTTKLIEFEKCFGKLFKEYPWKRWTCKYSVYGNETWLCNEETFEYSDESLNKGAHEFFNVIKPQIDKRINKNYLNDLYQELIDFSNPYLNYIRIEKRLLLLIWFAIKRNDPKLEDLKNKSLTLFKISKDIYKPELEKMVTAIDLIGSKM